MASWSSPLGRASAWTLIGVVLAALYLPMVPPLLFSLNDAGPVAALHEPTLHWYAAIWKNGVLVGAVWTSVAAAVIVGLVASTLGLLAAMAVRELKMRRLVLLLILMPLFIPGVSMGLSSALFFRQSGISPSLFTISIVQVLWALPFATLIILTVMATFDPVYLEAAYMHGANRWQAFRDVELPLISPGIIGAATFAMILSFNETERTALVQGALNTVQTYIWSTYKQIGLSPSLYALMSLLILLTLAMVVLFMAAAFWRERLRKSA
ncbi:MAG: ABC transporter permease subunit [Hyphomicrobiales bacterium]|nr:ABC transporter permease subunit [Hyphomicrobiales bacterium]